MNADVVLKGLYITQFALHKIEYFTLLAPGEVSGLGIVEEKAGEFKINDVYLFRQTNNAAYTEMHPEDIARFVGDIVRAGREDLISKFKFWWHSHAKIGVMWSGTDEETINTLSDEYSFSLVTNKRKEYLVRCDIYKPFRITLNNVPLIVEEQEDLELLKRCQEELDEKTSALKIFRKKKKGIKISTDDEEILKDVIKSIQMGGDNGKRLIYPPAGLDSATEVKGYSNNYNRGGRSGVFHRSSSSQNGGK